MSELGWVGSLSDQSMVSRARSGRVTLFDSSNKYQVNVSI